MDPRGDGAADPGLPGEVVRAEEGTAEVEPVGGGGGNRGGSVRLRVRRAVEIRHAVPPQDGEAPAATPRREEAPRPADQVRLALLRAHGADGARAHAHLGHANGGDATSARGRRA